MICRSFKMSAVSLVFFMAFSYAARAQVINRSLEANATMSFNSQSGIDSNRHTSFGASGAYDRFGKVALLGEFVYQPMGSTFAERDSMEMVGAGARYYLRQSTKICPYVVGIGGYSHYKQNVIGAGKNTGTHSGYFAAGGGASLYASENIGIRPELRYERDMFTSSALSFNSVRGSISVFYVFGGSSAKK